MNKKELYELGFEKGVVAIQLEGCEQITTYEALKDFAIKNIEEDSLFLARHILDCLDSEPAEYYDYDYCMGTMQDPTPLRAVDDLEQYCED